MEYRLLPESIIIFICTGDPFGRGFPQYTFKNICLEEKELVLQDESTKYFFNSEAAKNFLRMNVLTLEQIAQGEDLPLKKVQELAEEIAAEKEKQ